MKLTVRRSSEAFKHTSWRPASSNIEQVQVVENVRRIVYGPQKDKVTHRRAVTVLSAVDVLLAGGGKDYIDARIEEFVGGQLDDGLHDVTVEEIFADGALAAARIAAEEG